mmetsp:Transcript_1267/g.4535  ORF Transcript_1267/g.4535 Transcript_1267/m.4535 type:complete len:256 (+) Transcript_1267:301-1068(+)
MGEGMPAKAEGRDRGRHERQWGVAERWGRRGSAAAAAATDDSRGREGTAGGAGLREPGVQPPESQHFGSDQTHWILLRRRSPPPPLPRPRRARGARLPRHPRPPRPADELRQLPLLAKHDRRLLRRIRCIACTSEGPGRHRRHRLGLRARVPARSAARHPLRHQDRLLARGMPQRALGRRHARRTPGILNVSSRSCALSAVAVAQNWLSLLVRMSRSALISLRNIWELRMLVPPSKTRNAPWEAWLISLTARASS